MLTIPLTNENFDATLQQMFFGYKKADLEKYVATKAKTTSARRLKASVKKERNIEESTSGDETQRAKGAKLPTLGAFEAE